jgi:hypothetical protein
MVEERLLGIVLLSMGSEDPEGGCGDGSAHVPSTDGEFTLRLAAGGSHLVGPTVTP